MFTANFAIPNEGIEQMARKNDGASAPKGHGSASWDRTGVPLTSTGQELALPTGLDFDPFAERALEKFPQAVDES